MIDSKFNYKSIYISIKEDIIKNIYPVGSLLPTELTLASKYSVSRPTIAKVYNQLQAEGFIKKKKGLGSIIIYKYSNSTYTFGLLLPGAGESEIFSIINDQFLKQSENGKFNCLWEGATASNADIRKTLIEACCDNYIKKGVDGIFFAPLERVKDAREINLYVCNEIKKAGIPLLLIDRDILKFPERSGFDIVCLDNFSAGCVMAQHLIDSGCETIHFFYRTDSATSVNLRLAGIRETALNNKIKFDDNNVYYGDPADLELVKQIKIIPGKTGIICANDATAAVLMSSLDTIGPKIASDLLICGYDDMKYSSHLKYSLTSFRQPCEEIADACIELMMIRVKNKNSAPVTVNLTGEIVVRESSIFIYSS
jgi:DNA-binding LacI/PurR family transcriptional regulator